MYLVSACLAGINSRYDGRSTDNEFILDLVRQGKAIYVCPEQLGGLPTPRPSCEISEDESGNKKIVNKEGRDCTKEFHDGAERVLAIAKTLGIKKAILKAKSPSCGYGSIYDGTFSGNLIDGNGVTAQLLTDNDIEVYTENDLERFKKDEGF